MRYLQIKAFKIYKILIEWELARSIFRYAAYNLMLPHWIRQYALFALISLPIQSSFSYQKLRCFLSNQPNSILTAFKLNRFRFKQLVSKAQITGVFKSTW